MRLYLAKLPEELDEGAFTERVGEAGVKSQSGVLLGQQRHPAFLIQTKKLRGQAAQESVGRGENDGTALSR